VDSFLKDPQKRLEDFENIKKAKDYRAAARRYVLMIAELLRKQRVDEADRIFRTLLEHWKTPSAELPERQEIAGEALKLLSRPDCIKVLVKSLTDPGKQRREKVASILYAAGPDAAPPLIKQLAETEDRNARRLICEILTRLGPDVAEHIKARAVEPHVPWYLLRNLIMILGDMKSDILADELEQFHSHSHHRVREEALVYAAKAMGTSSEPYLVRALQDEDPLVHRRAVRLLSRFPQLSEEAINGLASLMVKKPQEEPPPEAEQAVELAAKVLSRMGNVNLGGQKGLEDLIIESMEADTAKGFFGKLTGGKSKRTPKMRLALVEALAEVGTKKSRKLLTALTKDKDSAIKESAQKALEKIGA
jgi:HEAT repeat protein